LAKTLKSQGLTIHPQQDIATDYNISQSKCYKNRTEIHRNAQEARLQRLQRKGSKRYKFHDVDARVMKSLVSVNAIFENNKLH
jgi:hypothetical protein